METTGKKRSQVVRRGLWATLAVGFVLACLPAWFPWAARPVLAHFGLHFDEYHRLGMTRFSLDRVHANWETCRLKVERVECVLPTTWLWRKLFAASNSAPTLILSNGVLTVGTVTHSPVKAGGKNHSSGETLDEIQRIGLLLKDYVPAARLTDCVIRLPSTQLSLPAAEWQNDRLRARVQLSNSPAPLELETRIAGRRSITLSLDWAKYEAGLHGEFTRKADQWDWAGEVNWMTNRLIVSAEFTTNSWWPARARLDAQEVRVPAERLRLKGYHALTATLALDLVSNEFNLQATGFALPVSPARARGLPPVRAVLQARGNPDSFTLEQLQLESPFAQATLTNALGIKRSGELLDQAARLKLSVDLSRVPGLSMTGRIGGALSVGLPADRQPVAHFSLEGTQLGAFGFTAKSVRVNGKFDWPWFTFDALKVNLDDGSELSAGGQFDFASNTLHETRWRASGAFLKSFLPGLDYTTLRAFGTVEGPLTNLTQSGEMAVDDLQTGFTPLKPLQVSANWQGEGWKLTSAQVKLAAGDAVLSAEGSLDLISLKQRGVDGLLKDLSLTRNGEEIYALQQPCPISFHRLSPDGKSPRWQLQVDHFDWRGHDKELALTTRLDWPATGAMALKARHVASEDFTNFVQSAADRILVPQLDLAANWSNGPVHLTASAAAEVGDPSGRRVTIQGRIEAGKNFKIQELSLGSEFAPALTLRGTLPIQIAPGAGKGWLVPDYQTNIDLVASSQAGTNGLSLPFVPLGKLDLTDARFQAHATGTLAQPTVGLKLGVASLRWRAETNSAPGPQVDRLTVDATATPGLITLSRLAFNLDEQPVSASGEWPLPKDFWETIWSHKFQAKWELPDWRTASGRVHVQHAQLAALARYVPTMLAPAGNLDLDLKLAKGGKLDGWLTVTNASTRSLGPLSPVRDISARVRFDGSQALLERCDGELGGQPLRISGQAAFPSGGPSSYQFHLEGTNVPLARSLEFLLRGDFDLNLRGKSGSPPALSGGVKLRHGLYVRYLSDLLWSGPRRPTPHPPYFSVTNQWFADWKLDLTIQGNRFLRVQTPVFSCAASADAKLSGTLRTPVLAGTAHINSGLIKFPFGTLQVNDGNVSLNGDDPRGPNLDLHAAGMTYNYEVRLDVTGPADDAKVVFSSTPPLNSEEILLLLTAGEIPQNEYTFSTEARAGRLVTFLGKDWLGRFTGDNGSEPRWIVKSGEYISEEGRLTYSVEYRITDRWSIIGEYDQYDQYNANLKWRIISR